MYTHYIGNIVYEGSTLAYIITEVGRLVAFGTGTDRKFLYEYNLKDHLGNSRVTFMGTDLGGAVDIVQTTSYYPFGLVINQMNGNTATGYNKNKYLYNGKELQDDVFAGSSLNWFDYGARFYDPQIGRFITVDPLIEERDWLTPYNYVQNNPLLRIDPDGRSDDIIDIEKSTGKITVTGAAGDDVVRLIDDGKVEASYSYGSNGSFTLENVVEKSNKGTTVTSTESDKAEKFYQFAAGSDVEFAKIDVQSPKGNDISVVATSHSIPNVHTLWITRDYSKRGFTGIKQSHSHSLGESVPSGHYGYEEGNPKSLMPYTVNGNKVKDALNAVQTKSLPGFENIKFEVYNPVNKTKSTYDGVHRAKINIPE